MGYGLLKRFSFFTFPFLLLASLAWGQNQVTDSVLPPNHLLENLPWLSDDGKIESKGLFDFEDIRGLGEEDMILVYRQAIPVNELDKPHDQTLVVCFYDPTKKKYIKNFEDDGGPVLWIKVITQSDKKRSFMLLQRDDLKGNQVLKGFAYINGNIKQVLEAMAPAISIDLKAGGHGPEVWCSSKEKPKNESSAEHVFYWDDLKAQFVDRKIVLTANGWSGFSVVVATPIVEAKANPDAKNTGAFSALNPEMKKHKAANGWWDEPLDAKASLGQLKTEIVPNRIKNQQIVQLGQDAKAFFNELQKQGITGKEITAMRSVYYSAVASVLFEEGNSKDAAYYLKISLSYKPDNPDALALKDKIKN